MGLSALWGETGRAMNKKTIHKTLGGLLLLPLVAWAISGAFFFIKPGYQAAFAPLEIKTYPLDEALTLTAQPQWQELRLLRTVLGNHLLIKEEGQYHHLDANTLAPMAPPTQAQLRLLLEDAIASDPLRYGHLTQLDDNLVPPNLTQPKSVITVHTSTGVELTLDWGRLQLRQLGADTRFINGVYSMHYLQWTPYKGLNKVLGFVGLVLLFGLALSGSFLLLRSSQEKVRYPL